MNLILPPLNLSKAKAWSAHAVTSSGVILAMLALLAVVDNRPQACLLWLGAALLVDGLDGTLARKFDVKAVLPHFDGSTLDLVIDYSSLTPNSGLPLVLYHRPGLDATDDIIVLANAGHERN